MEVNLCSLLKWILILNMEISLLVIVVHVENRLVVFNDMNGHKTPPYCIRPCDWGLIHGWDIANWCWMDD